MFFNPLALEIVKHVTFGILLLNSPTKKYWSVILFLWVCVVDKGFMSVWCLTNSLKFYDDLYILFFFHLVSTDELISSRLGLLTCIKFIFLQFFILLDKVRWRKIILNPGKSCFVTNSVCSGFSVFPLLPQTAPKKVQGCDDKGGGRKESLK